jgi:isopenicillin N synthase-like dioxygenase
VPENHDGESVPVIDIAPAATGSKAAVQIAKEIGSACQQIGFLVITGHGVDGGCLEEMHEVCKAYFELPEQTKRLACADPPDRFRGYTGPGDRGGAAGSPPDLLETFEACSFETPQDMAAAGYSAKWWSQQLPNLWAPQPPEMKDVWHRYMGEMDRLANKLMRLAALSLDLPEDWFNDKYDRSCSYQVANYYPPQFEPPIPGQLRQSAHTDFGAFTILYQDSDVGGLQVRTRSGGWTGVPALKGAFVINLGDLLAKWTNDRWVATEHRVVNPPLGTGTARISIPFFHHPNKDAVIEPIPTCVDAQHPARYPAVKAGSWTEFRMANYTLPQAG